MKQFLAYYLVLITLLAGVVSSPTFKNQSEQPVTHTPRHQQSIPNPHQSFFSASDLFISVGVNNEQIRLTNSIQSVSSRIFPSLVNTYRIQHSTLVEQQIFFTGSTAYLLNSANKQLDGYYLYYLRKLLI